jgi:hypothetical protein
MVNGTGDKIADVAAQKLAKFLAEGAQGNKVDDVARLAFVQATITQAAVDALVTLLKHHNIVSAPEVDRALALSCDSMRERLNALPRIQTATVFRG